MGAAAAPYEPLLDDDGSVPCCPTWDEIRGFPRDILPGILGALAALLIVVPLLYWPYQWSLDDGKSPEFTVAVAGFSGLDDLARGTAPLDPAFDLTVRIKEPRKYSAACVPRGTAAAVSYRGARLAGGPVPGFCGRSEDTTETGSVMAWGAAVPVPRFARDRLAEELARGEAVVDVTLTGPARYCVNCYQMVIECKARLGGGEASPPCAVRYELPTLPDDPRRVRQHQARKELRTPQ